MAFDYKITATFAPMIWRHFARSFLDVWLCLHHEIDCPVLIRFQRASSVPVNEYSEGTLELTFRITDYIAEGNVRKTTKEGKSGNTKRIPNAGIIFCVLQAVCHPEPRDNPDRLSM